jgi:hypothetical protein
MGNFPKKFIWRVIAAFTTRRALSCPSVSLATAKAFNSLSLKKITDEVENTVTK